MKRIAMAIPVLPGKVETFRRFQDELRGPRHADFVTSRRRAGIREWDFCQQTADGQACIVTLEGEDPVAGLGALWANDDDFTNWFVQQIHEIHGVDLRQPPAGPLPETIVDSGSPTEDNKAVVRRFLDEVLMGRNTAAADEILAPTYRNYLTGTPEPITRENIEPVAKAIFQAFPDLQLSIHSLIAEGDNVAGRMTMTGTHRGDFQGIPATGKRISVTCMPQWRLEDGKIVEDWPGFDPLTLMQQVGALPAAGHASQPVSVAGR